MSENSETAIGSPSRRTFLQSSGGALAAMALLPELGLGSVFRINVPLNVAVIGVGRQGRSILSELQKFDNVTIAAICDANPGRLRSGARRVKGVATVESYQDILSRDDVTAVFIATPTHLHRAIAVEAIAAGKHVYCEAPIAHTIEDCKAIAQAARASSAVFQVGLLGRTNPVYTLANTFRRSGAIRDVISSRAQYHRKTTWRTAASSPEAEKALNWKLDRAVSLGLVGEFGTHQIDVVNWFVNKYPVAVRGAGSIQAYDDGREVYDTINCELTYEDGTRLMYDATVANSYEGQYELIAGTMGTIKLGWSHGWLFKEADAPTQGWEVYANRQQFHNEEGITLIANATQLADQGKLKDGIGLPFDSLHYAIEAFLKSVTNGSDVVATADVGARATIIGILANQAIVEGREIAIDSALLKEG